MQTLLKVTVQDTENIIFQGEVDRVTSYNEVGRFDVYPMHANFISIIKQGVDLYLHHQKVKELKLEQAVMKVKKDEVHIFLGIETLNLDDIDPLKNNQNAQLK
jgi:F0F1-type ATP synthase epsilon subunit